VEDCRKHKDGCIIANVTFDKNQMQEIVDEKIKEFEVDIRATQNKAIDEFAEKLILRLEHEKKGQEYLKFNAGDYTSQVNIHKYAICCYELVIYIVNKLAEQMKGGV
jgi:hypothetical protein